MRKKAIILFTAALIAAGMEATSYAAGWQQNDNGWWYDNGDGTYPVNGWQWIDGNGDGVSERYYFDANGYLITNTTTPDGCTVNGDGAWVENSVIQNKHTGKDADIDTDIDTDINADTSMGKGMEISTETGTGAESAGIEGIYWQKQVTINGIVYQLPFNEDRVFIERQEDGSYLMTKKMKIEYLDGTSDWNITTAKYRAADNDTFISFDHGWKSTIKIIDGMTLRSWQWDNSEIFQELCRLN